MPTIVGDGGTEVAELLPISEGTVGKRYSTIYSAAGVESKAEPSALYHPSTAGNPLIQTNV